MSMQDFYAVLERLTGNEQDLNDEADEHGLEGEAREIETKVLFGQKLSILGFDSCVMGMLEVGYQFANLTETIIASEGSVPSAGWTYAKLLGCLTRGDTEWKGHQRSCSSFR
jgi:hypothetical protein